MTDDTKDGGVAFPATVVETRKVFAPTLGIETEKQFHVPHPGMSLRDYFAAKAMAGMVADPSVKCTVKESVTAIVKFGYLMADEMLKERSK